MDIPTRIGGNGGGHRPRDGRWRAAIPVLAAVGGSGLAAMCVASPGRESAATLAAIGALIAGPLLLRAATRAVLAPLLFGGTFLLTLWLLTPSERIVFASDRDTPGRLQIYALDGGGGFDRISATPGQDDSPAVAPDGRRIAFTRRLDGREGLFIANGRGDPAMPAPGGAGNDRRPTWSPDGRWLAFASDRGGDWDVYIMATDGSRLRNISRHPARDEWPTWSPDGRQLAFESDRGGAAAIWLVAADGADPRPYGDGRAVRRQPAWSPDGRHLAYVAGAEAGGLCVADLGGGVRWCLTGPGSYAAPSWSPSGERLAYAARGSAGWEIFVIPATGGAASNASRHPGLNLTPGWASNGPLPALSRWWAHLPRSPATVRYCPRSINGRVSCSKTNWSPLAAGSMSKTR